MKIKTSIFYLLIILAIIQLPLLLPLAHKGLFTSHDNVQVVRIFEMYQSIRYGGFPSRWSSGLLFGHGYPLYTFYSPLIYLIGSVLPALGLNYLIATKLVFVFCFFLGALGAFVLGSYLFGALPGFMVALAFSLSPYRAVDIYVRGALAEFFALALIPWAIWMNIRVWQTKKIGLTESLGLAVILSSVILGHNLSSFILLFLLIPLNVYFFLERSGDLLRVKRLWTAFLGGVFCLVLTCFYWLPLLMEMKYVQLSKFGDYPYKDYFLTIEKWWSSPWGYGGYLEASGVSLMFGKTLIILSILALVLNNIFKTSKRGFINFLFGGFVILTTLEMQASAGLWNAFEVLHYIQFPWRFHVLTTIIAAILTGAVIFIFQELVKERKWPKYLVVLAVILTSCAIGVENIDKYRPTAYTDGPIASETTTWYDEYLPIWVKQKPKDYAPDKIWISTGSGQIKDISWGYLDKSFTVSSEEKSRVTIAHVYYPGWVAKINGQETYIDYHNERGLMEIYTDKGENIVNFSFQRTWYRTFSEIVSLLGWVFLIIWMFRKK